MAKHLKVRAELSKDKLSFDLRILEQSHTGDKFGGGQEAVKSFHRTMMFVHDKVVLVSRDSYVSKNEYRDYNTEKDPMRQWNPPKGTQRILLCGRGVIKGIPVEAWGDIKAAIEAYNEFYK